MQESASAWQRWRDRVVERWPEHAEFIERAIAASSQAARETAAVNSQLIERLAGREIDELISGYRWMCEMVLEEELEFRRAGRYRYATFEEAKREVYANEPVMRKYMAGLLLSQVLWPNHIAVFDYYVRKYLTELLPDQRHLEIGPGHGLLLFHAAERTPSELVGWDISPTSLEHTATCLRQLGASATVRLERRDLFEPLQASDEGSFGSVVISEVLEHVEKPEAALATVAKVLTPNGRAFVNAPVNSPALDHIYHYAAPEELIDMVERAGFAVESVCIAPAAGYDEARARRHRLPISVAIVCRK